MIKPASDLIAEAQTQIECLDVSAAKALYDECDGDAVILDVREKHNADEAKLEGSINISRGLLEMQTHKHCPDVDAVILTHCGGGGRASLAALTLKNMGYQKVYAITAPFDEIKKIFG